MSLTLLVPSPPAAPDSVYSAPLLPCDGPHSACAQPLNACYHSFATQLRKAISMPQCKSRKSGW